MQYHAGMHLLSDADRGRFRRYPLDGARLYFHPATGTQIRIATEATRSERRTAPRVAMFGITNACNLRCDFCSRDQARPSLWTVESALAVLKGLSRAGTLEVAFGGGEPFAFRGFDELVAELHQRTPLAVHVTTNGTLIDKKSWPRFAGRFGQVRLSLYDDQTFRRCANLFAATGQKWGANILVDEPALWSLPAQLAELAAAGCHDVSLLSYVGVGAERQLSATGRARLARLLEDSPLPCRLSVCFGDRVPVPRLFAGFDNDGDCGAGHDFITITPDQQVQSCSFQDGGVAARTADEILAAWGRGRAAWAHPAARSGCARVLPLAQEAPPLPAIAIWQGFSGNNSGECVLVAKFQTVAAAESYLGELLPGWPSDTGYPAEWHELFAAEQVAAPTMANPASERDAPAELTAIGSSVLALGHAADDAFPELRALAWKRGAYVVAGGIHVHDPLTCLVAVRCQSSKDVAAIVARPRCPGSRAYPYGDALLLRLPLSDRAQPEAPQSLAAAKDEILRIAEHRPVAVELFEEPVTDADMVAVMKHLGEEPARQARLHIRFWEFDRAAAAEKARQLAQTLQDQQVTRSGGSLLIDPVRGRKRLAVLAYRRDAYVHPLDGAAIEVAGRFWLEPPRPQKGKKAEPRILDSDRLHKLLHEGLPKVTAFEFNPDCEPYRHSTQVKLRTTEPALCMRVLASASEAVGSELDLGFSDTDALGWAVRRLLSDVRGLSWVGDSG